MNKIGGIAPLVGRQNENALFLRLLDEAPSGKTSVCMVWGQGGIGKTKLLEHFAYLAEERLVPHSGLIDFYLTTNQRVYYFVENLVNALGREEFADYLHARNDYYRVKELTTDQTVLGPKLAKMRTENYAAFNRLSKSRRIVLFFDTFEVVQDRDAGKFLLFELLPHLSNFIVIISGRRKTGTIIPNCDVQSFELTPLSINDAYGYLDICGLRVSRKEAEEIWLLSGGRPILLSLTVDWLRETTQISALAQMTPEDYEESLVCRIRSLAKPEHETILLMAHVYHRFDSSILAFLTGQDESLCETILSQLSRLSFIKYKPSMRSCMLHDEMRDLVISYVWYSIDSSGEMRRNLSLKLLPYYDKLIYGCSEYDQRMVYVTEQMYHRVYADPDQGIASFLDIFDSTFRKSRLGYCDMLIREVSSLSQLLDESQNALITLSRCRLLYQIEDKSGQSENKVNAIAIATQIAHSTSVNDLVRQQAASWLHELYVEESSKSALDKDDLTQ